MLLKIGLNYDWLLYKEYILLAKTTDFRPFLENTYRTEYAYDALMWCYSRSGMPTNGFLILNGFFSYYLLFKALHRILNIKAIIGVILLALIVIADNPMFILNGNILRQQLAMSILLYCYSRNKYIKVVLASLMHKSSILLLVIRNRIAIVSSMILLVIMRDRLYSLLDSLSHTLYEAPSKMFVLLLIVSTLLLYKNYLLFNYGLVVLFFVFYTWNLTQISSRFVLYGHPILIAGLYFVAMKSLRALQKSNVKLY